MSKPKDGHPAEDAARLFRLVIDNIPQHIFWKDTRSVYLGCNANFAVVAGVGSPEEIVGKTDYDLPWRKDEAAFFRKIDA
jgi:PAS domain-containing protein